MNFKQIYEYCSKISLAFSLSILSLSLEEYWWCYEAASIVVSCLNRTNSWKLIPRRPRLNHPPCWGNFPSFSFHFPCNSLPFHSSRSFRYVARVVQILSILILVDWRVLIFISFWIEAFIVMIFWSSFSMPTF